MAVYRETDGDLVREYQLQTKEDTPLLYIQTGKACLELVPTKSYGRVLFLDNVLQFAEADEYIYHELLIHPCLSISEQKETICILGGGDGCAVREVLKWPGVKRVDLIDWDSEVTRLFQQDVTDMNKGALQDRRVTIENKDLRDLIHEERHYDCVIVDLLDPEFEKPGQLELWEMILSLVNRWRNPGGSVCMNLGGLLPWETESVCFLSQLLQEKVPLPHRLYKTFVPSFGKEWCFALLGETTVPTEFPVPLRYLTHSSWGAANHWSPEYRLHLNPVYDR